MKANNTLGDTIRSLRKRAKMTQEELADGICSPVSISRIENGNQMPSGNVLDALHVAELIRTERLDEATSALDAETADRVERSFLALDGVTCITVTHKMSEEILTQYDETFLMEDGRLM